MTAVDTGSMLDGRLGELADQIVHWLETGKRPVGIETLEQAADSILAEIEAAGPREIESRKVGVRGQNHPSLDNERSHPS